MRTHPVSKALVVAVAAAVLSLTAWAAESRDQVEQKNIRTTTGFIKAIDQQAGTVTVRAFLIGRSFKLAPNCLIVTKETPDASMDQLKVGTEVQVRYVEESGVLMAHRIAQRGAERDRRDR